MTCWVSIFANDGYESCGCGAQIPLPQYLFQDLMIEKKEIEKVFAARYTKHGYAESDGPMGFLTQGTFPRSDAIKVAVKMALAGHARRSLYETPRV